MAEGRVGIAVVTTDSFFSYSILKSALSDPAIECKAMVILPGSGRDSPLQAIRRVYRRSGSRLVGYKVVIAAVVGVRGVLARVGAVGDPATPSSLAAGQGAPIRRARDCNADDVVAFLEEADVEVLLSVNVYQRMLEPLLATPRVAALNTHFGMLPKYRGMSPVLWAMAQGESEIGLTVHKMVLAFDEGLIVRQRAMPLLPGDSVLSATVRGCSIARGMLVDAIHDVATDPGAGRPQAGEGSYYSLPTRGTIRQLNGRRRRLWSVGDLPRLG